MRESTATTRTSMAASEAGFTLAEMAIALLIIGLLLFVLLPTTGVMRSNSNRTATQQKLNNIDTALVNFVIVNKRLPCPADGAKTDTTAGVEGARDGSGDCSTFTASG